MAQKGTKIGEKTVTLKRYEESYNDNNVRIQISVADVDGLEEGQAVLVSMKRLKGQSFKWSELFKREIHNSGKKFSVPLDIVEDRDIKPGTDFKFTFYEEKECNVELSDDASVIDRVDVVADPSSTDGCDQRLYSESIANYLEKNSDGILKFRNVNTGKEEVGKSHNSYGTQNHPISFPIDVRNAIDAEPGHLIEVMGVSGEDENNDELERQDKIDVIHSMVSEMYDAYLESKND